MIGRIIGYVGLVSAAAFGAIVGSWAQQPYPLSVIERNVLTPTVKPGEDVRVELVVDRRQRCPQIINRFVQYPNGDREPGGRDLPSTFGRMGRDVYVLKVPTNPTAPYGPAEIYSTGEARCNPYQEWVKPVESGDPWHDKFSFGPETKNIPSRHFAAE
jgi:hypothetical protein